MLVVKAVASGKLPKTLLDVNEAAAKRYILSAGAKELAGFNIEETSIVVDSVR